MRRSPRHDAALAWVARWIWTAGPPTKPFQVVYLRGRCDGGSAGGPVRIHCAADSKYRLWLNGEYVGFGPARGDPAHPYYDTHRVRLRRGPNTLAFLVQHYTDPLAIFAPVRGGLICQVQARRRVLGASGASWRALNAAAYAALPGRLFPERWDGRLEPEGWERPDFDDRRWRPAIELSDARLAEPAALVPRPIPLLAEKPLGPVRVLDAGCCQAPGGGDIADELAGLATGPFRAGQADPPLGPPARWPARPLRLRLRGGEAVALVLDFGRQTLAAPELELHGPAGTLVDLGYSECLDANRVATRWQGLRQSERLVLRDGLTRHRLIQPRGFRYMLLRLANPSGATRAVIVQAVAAHEAIYPARFVGRFACSDPLLNRIHALSLRTLNLCMEDAYTDCPWRERSQYVGDFQIEGLATCYALGPCALARKAVAEFATGRTAEGWVPAVFPAREAANLPTFGMRIPVIMWDHYRFGGDRALLRRSYAAVRSQMSWLARHEGRGGIVEGLPGWLFIDWTPLDAQNANDAVVQGWYLEALESAARIATALGERADARVWARGAARLRRTLLRLYWDESRGAFRRYRPASPLRPRLAAPDLIGQHENFLLAHLRVGSERQRRRALDAIAGVTGRYLPNLGDYQSRYLGQAPQGDLDPQTVNRHGDPAQSGNYCGEPVIRIGSPFWSYYALESLMAAGRGAAALEYMRLGWGLMLEFGATSCWEMWDRHTSHCHGWSTAPAVILPAHVLGIRPLRPGFRSFAVDPQLADLTWARGRVPTPRGAIDVHWHLRDGAWHCRLEVPPGTTARFHAPPSFRLHPAQGSGEQHRRRATLGPGTHRFRCVPARRR